LYLIKKKGRTDNNGTTLVTHLNGSGDIRYQFMVDKNGLRIPGSAPVRIQTYNATTRPWYIDAKVYFKYFN
jgi:hypothetical protein